MGIITSIKVRLALGLCLLLVPESFTSLCPHRRQYWHEQKEKCVTCTACQAGQIVIRPCQVHRDAQCGPISELNIDWSFLSRRAHKHNTPRQHKHYNQHQNKHHEHQQINLFNHEKHQLTSKAHHSHHAHHSIKPESFQIQPMHLDTPREEAAKLESARVRSSVATPVPFSAVEKLVWDWQVVVLVLSVFACLLFFLVTGIYSIYHARYWRPFKGSFDSDVEEAYARRSLMVPGHAEPHAAPPPLDPQGLCMDQLLVRKKQEDLGTAKGNVYIVRDKSKESQGDSR